MVSLHCEHTRASCEKKTRRLTEQSETPLGLRLLPLLAGNTATQGALLPAAIRTPGALWSRCTASIRAPLAKKKRGASPGEVRRRWGCDNS